VTGHFGFIQNLGIERGAYGEGRSEMHITIGPEHMSPTKTVHGAVLYGLADTCMGSALWTLMADGETCATISCSIDYLHAVREGVISCEAEVVSKGRRTAMVRSVIRRDDGEVVAQTAASFWVGPIDERRTGKGSRRAGLQPDEE